MVSITQVKTPTSNRKTGFTLVATLASSGTFFQLDDSRGYKPAQALYLNSPSYISNQVRTTDAPPAYDNAVTVGCDWKCLEDDDWNPTELRDPARSYLAR